MISAILALANLVPSVLPLFTKNETANKTAQAISSVAQAVTGASSDDGALAALKADPAKLIEYQQQMNAQALAIAMEETKRLEAVNVTIQAEIASGDPYVRRWRPTFGYAACGTWVLQGIITFAVVAYIAIAHPDRLVSTISAMKDMSAAMSELWFYAMCVLGIAVWKRSDDKKVAAGQTVGPIAAIGALFGRK